MDRSPANREAFLQIILNNIPSFVFWKDRASIYQGCNLNFAISAGLDSPEDIVGKSDYDLPWSKEQSDFFRKIDNEVMASGKAKINFEESQTISNGLTKWLRTSKIPLKNDEGEVIGILGTYEDITDRKLMEIELVSSNQSLMKLNTKLEMINLDLEQFAYATSHDLKEPIRVIGGFSGLLKRRYADILDKEGNEYLRYITDSVNRMSKLVGQILIYSKIEKIEEQFMASNMYDILEEVMVELEILIREKNASVQIINLPTQAIKCQPQRMKMLFYNLITNGIKFNTSDVPQINIDYEEREQDLYFSVSDNGIGIDEKYRNIIFKPFKRLNTRNNFPGNGIGLSICNRIVKIHGGNMHCKENEQNGTVFYFTFPKERPDTH